MADEVAFALRQEYASDFAGGTTVLGADGKTLDYGAKLKSSSPYVTRDPVEIEALRGVPALEEVSTKKGGKS